MFDSDDPFGEGHGGREKLSAVAAQAEKDGILRVARNARGHVTSTELIPKAERERAREAQAQLVKNATRAAAPTLNDDDAVGF
jgi:hypothetical protein